MTIELVRKIATATNGGESDTGTQTVAGIKTFQDMPYVKAYPLDTTVYASGATVILVLVETADVGGNFASNTFTAPQAGRYLITMSLGVTAVTGAVTSVTCQLRVNGSGVSNRFPWIYNNAGTIISNTLATNSMVLNLAAGDAVTFYINPIGGTSVKFDPDSYSNLTITKVN